MYSFQGGKTMGCVSRAALYIRVSTEEQAVEGLSIPAQIETLTQYCKLYGIEVYDIYKDLGISGKETRNRPGLMKMLLDAKECKFDLILVWKISRLSRSLKDLLMILDELEKSNVLFISYSEKFDTSTAVGKMTLQLLGSIAEFERNTIIDNVKLGLREYARKGGKTGTVLGYDNHNKQLVINPSEAEIIKMIFMLYINRRMSMSEIAGHLNSLGCKTKRNNCFNKDSIGVILSNPVYIGINRHKIGQVEEYETVGIHQPIVDNSTWQAAQKLRQSNKNRRVSKNKQCNFLLSGKIQCPKCSSYMYSFTTMTSSKTYRYYKCKSCKNLCNASSVEAEVIDRLKKQLRDTYAKSEILSRISPSHIKNVNNNNLKVIKQESKRVQKLLDKYVMLLDNEAFASSNIIADKIKELEHKLKNLQNKLDEMKADDAAHTISSYLNEYDITQIFNSNDVNSIKKIIDPLIEYVVISSQNTIVEIYLLPQNKEL
jgi:site-specific DNA recombinase